MNRGVEIYFSANNSVPTTGLTPCIIIVHVTCNYSGAEKNIAPVILVQQGFWSGGPTSPRKRAGYNGP